MVSQGCGDEGLVEELHTDNVRILGCGLEESPARLFDGPKGETFAELLNDMPVTG